MVAPKGRFFIFILKRKMREKRLGNRRIYWEDEGSKRK